MHFMNGRSIRVSQENTINGAYVPNMTRSKSTEKVRKLDYIKHEWANAVNRKEIS